MAGPRFGFFEVVRITGTAETQRLGVALTFGTVVGISHAESAAAPAAYAIAPDGQDETVMLSEASLRPTGRWRSRDDLYDHSSLRVSADGLLLGDQPA